MEFILNGANNSVTLQLLTRLTESLLLQSGFGWTLAICVTLEC